MSTTQDSTAGAASAAPQLSATPLADLTLVLAGVVEQRDGLRAALEGAAAALMMAAAGEIERDGLMAAWNDCGAALAATEVRS